MPKCVEGDRCDACKQAEAQNRLNRLQADMPKS